MPNLSVYSVASVQFLWISKGGRGAYVYVNLSVAAELGCSSTGSLLASTFFLVCLPPRKIPQNNTHQPAPARHRKLKVSRGKIHIRSALVGKTPIELKALTRASPKMRIA